MPRTKASKAKPPAAKAKSLPAKTRKVAYEDDASVASSNGSNNGSDSDEEPLASVPFTDSNAKWLKPAGAGSDDGEDGDSSEASVSQLERDAMLLDAENELQALEAAEDEQRQRQDQTAVYHLPTPEELALDEDRVVPPGELRDRVEAVIEVMQDFKNRREPGRSRSDYLDRLAADLSEYFGYLPELITLFLKQFSPSECLSFLDASDKPRPLVIRTNTLKARRKDLAQALIKRGVNLDPLAGWSKVGLKIYESTVPIGATPEYLAGHYMLQSAASMCPVMALDPKEGERVLDMSAAPGGKTTYIAQLMKNTGVIIANDLKVERQKATVSNLHRLGVKNTITCCNDGKSFPKAMGNFDRILLDAPCSGLGVISRDQSIKLQRTVKDIQRTAHLQKELLLHGIDSLNANSKTGGIMVYSTCSVSVEENEMVVQYILNKRDVKLVDTGLKHGKPGFTRYQERRFHPSVALTRRFYPHTHNMDGFYVAKFKKLSNSERKREEDDEDEEVDEDVDEMDVVVEKEKEKEKEMEMEEKGEDDDDDDDDEKKALRKKYMSGNVLPKDDESIPSEDEEVDDAGGKEGKAEEANPAPKKKFEKIRKGKKKKGKKEEASKEPKCKQRAGKPDKEGGGPAKKQKKK